MVLNIFLKVIKLLLILVFDTILMAVGRTANTKLLNLDKLKLSYNKNNLKIIGGYKD